VSGVPASTLAAGTYSGVITGLSISNIITGSGFSVTGTFPGGYSWELIQTSIASGIWDLVVTENLPQNTLSAVATSNSISVTGTSTLSTNGGSGSGNVTYALVSGPCSLSGATLTGTGVGNCVVTATKAADSTYVSATSAQLTVAVSLATQTSLVLAASSDSITVNGTSTLSTSGGSGTGNVTYALDGPCTLSGATLTGTDVGNCVVTATKAADSTFASRSATLTVSITAAPSSPNTIGAGSSVSLGSLIVGSNPVLSGGTLVLNNGDSSSVPFEVTSIGGTIQAPPSGSAVLSGVFSGSGGLTFTGTGTGTTTILSGTNTYTGGTTVSGGTLSVAGSSPTGSGDVFVSSAGSLMGTGTISGNITVRGVLKPGNSPGYLSMLQNLTLNSGATFIEDIAGTTPSSSTTPVGATGYYAVLNVGGQLIIDSGTTLTPRLSNLFSPSEPGFGSPIYVPVLGNVFRMITTTGGISGRFTTLTQPAELSSGTQLLAFYNVNNSKSIDLAVVPTSYSTSLAGGTPSVMSAASVLDQWVLLNKAGTATAAQNQLLFGVASQSAANLSAYVQANAAEILATAAATAPIPTLSEWAMILLVSLMGMWVFVTQRMSKRKATLQARQR
jgi:autotransporter-associated beta strand protein